MIVVTAANQYYPGLFSQSDKLTNSKQTQPSEPQGAYSQGQIGANNGYLALKNASSHKRSGVWFDETHFEVIKILADDTDGSQHQRLLVKRYGLPTLLVAHNIDLAPRIPAVVGQEISIRGRYEWNEKGGVIHWTHHDPKGAIAGGWIRVGGKRYY